MIRALLMIIVPCFFQSCLVKANAHDSITFLQLFDPLGRLLVTGCFLGERVGRDSLSPSFDSTIDLLEVSGRKLYLSIAQKLSIFSTIPVLHGLIIFLHLGKRQSVELLVNAGHQRGRSRRLLELHRQQGLGSESREKDSSHIYNLFISMKFIIIKMA